jgi:hypothetical protein
MAVSLKESNCFFVTDQTPTHANAWRSAPPLFPSISGHSVHGLQVSCDVIANPAQSLKFEWVFNSSSERLDVQENLIKTSGSRSVADHMPQVRIIEVIITNNFYLCFRYDFNLSSDISSITFTYICVQCLRQTSF